MNIDNYVLIQDKSQEWGLTKQTVWRYLQCGKIEGAKKVGRQWYIPKNASKPRDERYSYNKEKEIENNEK